MTCIGTLSNARQSDILNLLSMLRFSKKSREFLILITIKDFVSFIVRQCWEFTNIEVLKMIYYSPI